MTPAEEAYKQGFMDKCAARFKGLYFTPNVSRAAHAAGQEALNAPVSLKLNPMVLLTPTPMNITRIANQSPIMSSLLKSKGLAYYPDRLAYHAMKKLEKNITKYNDGSTAMVGGGAIPGLPVVWRIPTSHVKSKNIIADFGDVRDIIPNPHYNRGREILAHEAFHARNPILGQSEHLARAYGGWKAPRARDYDGKVEELKARISNALAVVKDYRNNSKHLYE
jgi:hypothetical protein